MIKILPTTTVIYLFSTIMYNKVLDSWDLLFCDDYSNFSWFLYFTWAYLNENMTKSIYI